MKVRVFNNRARRCLSVKAKFPWGWRVIAHTQRVELNDAIVRVSDARVSYQNRTGKKTDHTCIEGKLNTWFLNHGFSGVRISGFYCSSDTAANIDNAVSLEPLPREPVNVFRATYLPTQGGYKLRKDKIAAANGSVVVTRRGVYSRDMTLAA